MNGIALPTSAHAPAHGSGRRWVVWPVATLLALVAVAAFWGATRLAARDNGSVAFGKFHRVVPMDLDIKVRKDGELQAVNNIDVMCLVEGRNTIVFIVKEGESVKKGDLLVELDSSTIRQTLQTQLLEVTQAQSDLKNAREMLAIQENQNAADLAAAKVELDLAKLALQQYKDGTYPQELADAETLVRMTEITVRNKEEDLEQTKSLFSKGFVTAADVKQAELSVTTVHNDLRKAKTALLVLTKYKHLTDLATAESAVTQASQKLARVEKTNASMLSKSQADVDTKELALATKQKNLEKLQAQLEHCKIFAPADGMVVYSRDDDDYRLIEGAQVRERQRLIRLPDVSQMKVVLKINESQVPRLREGLRALVRVVGEADPIGATVTKISPMADGSSRWWNPELREYPVELLLDHTPAAAKPGLSSQAEIFIEQIRGAVAVPLASVYSQGRDSFVFARRGNDVEPAKVEIGAANETHARVASGLSVGEDVLVLAAGQGRQLLERAGIEPAPLFNQAPGAGPPEAESADATRPGARPSRPEGDARDGRDNGDGSGRARGGDAQASRDGASKEEGNGNDKGGAGPKPDRNAGPGRREGNGGARPAGAGGGRAEAPAPAASPAPATPAVTATP
ncbi:MAG TPA: HlyD family efflux transporter periplasmic adaptor subunit [Tepidisphaeraceae bacterium]|nr:HlyD family efflux transporter periplasmic adaptor subunit [Tepidisphaeraceae bacterium]